MSARFPIRWLAAAAAVGAAIASVLLLHGYRRATPIARLIEDAPREHRTLEARLCGFPWARWKAPPRGDAASDPADLRLMGTAGTVLEETADRQDPESRRAAGIANLLIAPSPESIAALEQAASRSNDARTWSDLAAARYALAVLERQPLRLVDALADADRALRIEPKLAEARFNRALLLERMGIREKASDAWRDFLEIDPSSAWSGEARDRLRTLDARSAKFDPAMLRHPSAELVRRFPEESREAGEGRILCEWAAGDPTALARARTIADALGASSGEHFLDDAVAAIERADDAGRATLAEANRIYCGALRKHWDADVEQLRRAAKLFARGGSPMADLASYSAVLPLFVQNRGPEAYEELLRLRARIDSARHRALSAEISWMLALPPNSVFDPETAVREGDAAAAIFRSLGERRNEAGAEAVAAEGLDGIGDPGAALSRRMRAVQAGCAGANRAPCNRALDDVAAQLDSTGRSEAALALIAAMTGDGEERVAELVGRARIAIRANRGDVAGRALLDARRRAARITDILWRDAAEAEIELEESTLVRATHPHRAIEGLNRSIDYLISHYVSYLLPYAYLQRARALRAAGDEVHALADYRAALQVLTKWERVPETATRSEILDETIDLHLSRGETADAFRAAQVRRRVTPAGAIPDLPAASAAIEYVILPDGVAVFCLTGNRIAARRIAIGRLELEMRIDMLDSAIRRRAPLEQVRRASSAVYELLLEPIRPQLAGVGDLVIVPDRQLSAVPFAALYDAKSGRYVVEDFVIRFAAAVLSVPAATALTPALVVADPPAMSKPRLREGRDEAERIASLHGGTLLAGEAATRASFLDAAQHSALIHYCGHAESDSVESNAFLLLADGSTVGESDIAGLQLTRNPLVVLAACGTLRGDPQRVAGMSGLSRAFLAAGARAVVGTLWEVDDDVAATFFLRFHRSLRENGSPAHALCAAQRAMLHSSEPRLLHPATWAPVELLSGSL